MTDQTPPSREPEAITPVALSDALGERYLTYALSTIMARSLPDVRDGLKPVHRRVLYAMRLLRLDPAAGFKKCARIVGDVMGKYHPHGDQAIYDSLVRLAQDFAQRYPLVEGQGNFGNIDGDNAAAMRYTEARLTGIAERLLQGIDEDAVDLRPTYDGEEDEPVVLPAAFPNLLANGAAGIAVGMATSVPPHNAVELCRALDYLIRHPNASPVKLTDFVAGPDFPTGGVLVETTHAIQAAYRTGRGAFRLRARWQVEQAGRGTWRIVVTEMPYQVAKGRLVEKIADLIANRKLPILADVRDESADQVRLVLEPRSRSVEPAVLMEHLFRLTELETRIGLNMNVLDATRTPRVMNLAEVLRAFLDHRHDVLVRVSRFRLAKIERRLEILAGYLVAYLDLDRVIRIIRDEDAPKRALIAAFDLTEVQAEAILNMRLRHLRRLQEQEIRAEHAELEGERRALQALLGDEAARWRTIRTEIRDLRKALEADAALNRRRTEIGPAEAREARPLAALIEREPITVICSEKGWIRAVKGHVENPDELRFKEGDRGRFLLHAETVDKLLLFATNGRFYTLGADKLPGGRGHGEPVRLMIELGNDQDVVALRVHRPGARLLVAASDGRGFVVAEEDVVAQTRNGKQALNVKAAVEAQACVTVAGDHVAIIGTNRKLLIFPLGDVPVMSRGRGVLLQRYRDGGLGDVQVCQLDQGLTWRTRAGRTHRETDLTPWLGKRAQAGRLAPRGFNSSNRFS